MQAASSAIGSGTILKSIKQQFTQGNIESSLNALDLAISGQGFFALKPSLTSTQTVYTRNGAFSVNNDRYVVDSQGQLLQVFPVNADGSVIATGIQSAQNLQLPTTSGLPKASQTIQLGLNLPADADIIPNKSIYSKNNPYVFDKTNPATYNKSTSITIYDSLGNPTIATIYYVKTSNATETSPTNKWQTHVFVGDREVTPQLISSKDDQGKTFYINKFGQITTDPQSVDPTFNAAAAHPLYKQDDQTNKTPSTAAKVVGSIIRTSGFDFGDTDANKVTIVTDPSRYSETREGGQTSSNPPYWGIDMFTISVDRSAPQSISINAGTYTGTQLAAELTRAVNAKFGDDRYFRIVDSYRKDGGAVVPGNDIIKLNLSQLSEDGSSVAMADPIEIDLLGTGGSAGTPPALVDGIIKPQGENRLQLTREELVNLAQTKLNDALNQRHLEFGKASTWPDSSNPPIKVGYDVAARALTFTVDPTQMGPDANEPSSRFNSVQVYNPTDLGNDLGIPPKTTSPDVLIRANTVWTGNAAQPGGDAIVDPREQRTGIVVNYNKDTRQFNFNSGSTGEASSITVGRSVLATKSDRLTQIDSYDFGSLTNEVVSFEINGRTLTFDGSAANSVDEFFDRVEQAFPVSFDDAKEVPSTSTGKQSIRTFGKLMKDDAFEIWIAKTPNGTPVKVETAGLDINPDDDVATRMEALKNAISDAFGTQSVDVDVDYSENELTFTYKAPGTVASLITMKQITRGSDGTSSLAPIQYTDARVIAGIPSVVDGTGQTKTVQTIPLKNPEGTAPVFAADDVFVISVPLQDGTVLRKEVKISGSTIDSLKSAANDAFKDSSGAAIVDFTVSDNSLVATYGTNGHVTGTIQIEHVATADATVRPPAIGPISVSRSSKILNNLEISGSPSGEPFRLNVRVDGQVRSKLPVGAQGSSSRVGRQLGEAKGLSYAGSNDLLGIGDKYVAQQQFVAGTGLPATAATAVGARGVTPMNQTFFLNEGLGENRMTFTVDGIVGTIVLPIRAYTGDTFATAIQERVNQIQDPNTGRTVSGVTVKYEPDENRLIFTSGTTGANSQINVVGHPNFGLGKVLQTPGSVPVITNLKQATDEQGNKLYVDADGKITTQAPQSTQNWYPLYLQEGQLTFDTVGKLISPKEGVVYSPFDPQNGSDLLRLNIDYGKYSTQFSSPFSVLSLSQDGYPSGSLNGLDIDASGTIRANYTNGQTVALGKVMIANFANPNGLKQVGNANYVATSVSGQVVLGQAGADGFGTIKAGALERSNVDITEELVNLITAQRNFQANAKAIETTTTLSQTIIQIRG